MIGNLSKEIPIIDEWGEETGECEKEYTIQTTYLNHAPPLSKAIAEAFGTNVKYEKVIALMGEKIDVSVGSVVWIETLDKTKPFEYVVVGVAKSLNSTLLSLRKEGGRGS